MEGRVPPYNLSTDNGQIRGSPFRVFTSWKVLKKKKLHIPFAISRFRFILFHLKFFGNIVQFLNSLQINQRW